MPSPIMYAISVAPPIIMAVTYVTVLSLDPAATIIGVTNPTTAAQNFRLVSFLAQSIFFIFFLAFRLIWESQTSII